MLFTGEGGNMHEKRKPDEKGDARAPLLIRRVALGVRFQPQFRVVDIFGELVDRILRSSGSPFGPSVFPLVRSNAMERVLVNEGTNESLHLNSRDAILEMNVDSTDFSDIERLAEDYSTYVLQNLRDLADLAGIERYGVLLKLDECRSELSQLPVEHYLSSEFAEARSLHFRFTRRLPCLEARVKRNVDDFRNVIYIVEQDEDNNVNIRVDYQEYFRPALDAADWRNKPYPKFVERGIDYFRGEFADWLRNLQSEPALVQ